MRVLCRLDEIEENSARGFVVQRDGEELRVLVARREGRAYGYLNVCPHRGTTLDWMPDQFMSLDRRYLQCATHAALFELETGACVDGPCRGQSLAPVALEVVDGEVRLSE